MSSRTELLVVAANFIPRYRMVRSTCAYKPNEPSVRIIIIENEHIKFDFMPKLSKSRQHLLNASKKSAEKRSKDRDNEIENENWKEKQANAPKATIMMTTDNFQGIVNQLACTGCGRTGKRLTYFSK